MSAITATEELTITLPKDLADLVRAEAAIRQFATPLDYLSYAVRASLVREAAEQEDWVRDLGVSRYDAYDADPSDVFTADEVRQSVANKLYPLIASR
jgi:hypothetical protein